MSERFSPDFPGREPLSEYWDKRDFEATTEPRGQTQAAAPGLSFVVQKHAASHLHYDFRLEHGGVLWSWAVPKGPSLDPTDKRLAIQVEDHPLDYRDFEGVIPAGQYGAGTVLVWDRGWWEPVGDARQGQQSGKLLFRLHGQKLRGLWELVRTSRSPGGKPGTPKRPEWLLFKKRDGFARARAEYDVVSALPDSVLHRSWPAAAPAPHPASPAADPLPNALAPQLATLASQVPAGDWVYELKFDGYRLLTRIEAGRAALYTRSGQDWTYKLPHLAAQLESLGLETAWLDGEIVVQGEDRMPDFQALQRAIDDPARVDSIVYFLFDLPFHDGLDLREAPLVERRHRLERLLRQHPTDHVRFSMAFQAAPGSLLASACRLKLEGLMAKRADARYQSGRSGDWLKLKCRQRQEFVVCGHHDRTDGSGQLGSLILGVHDSAGDLVPVGSVGTGWSAQEAAALQRRLLPLAQAAAPFAKGTPAVGRWTRQVAGSERWVRPELVVEVSFGSWTEDERLRHAVYIGLRSDKPASTVVRERSSEITGSSERASGTALVGGVRISHPERVIDPSTGVTKLELVRYCESVAEWLLPHLKGRPVSLVRAPEGVAGAMFFQKHEEAMTMAGLKTLPAKLWPGHAPLLEVSSVEALIACAQMNVVEFHTWNARSTQLQKPDRVVFDLDPGEGTSWQHIREAALLVRMFLQELGLQSWLKTSGGKGLHLVVPITPRLGAEAVKAFARAVVQHLARTIPSRFVAKSGPANRVGKLFVDYLRNTQGATTVAAFSARARPGLGVSMPIAWEELERVQGAAQWTVQTARNHLFFRGADPWAEYASTRQTLTAGLRLLGELAEEAV